MLFPDKSRTRRLGLKANFRLVMLPLKRLARRTSRRNDFELPRVAGIEPLRLLPARTRLLMLEALPNPSGM